MLDAVAVRTKIADSSASLPDPLSLPILETQMATAEKPQYKVIGTRPIRHDGVDKVTGRAKYGADVRLTGMLHGAILRSPHAHAKIRSVDTSKAEAPLVSERP